MLPVRRFLPCLLLLALLLWQVPAAADEGRDLEPLPRSIVFTDPGAGVAPLDIETDREIRDEIQRSFASLGSVVHARQLLVRRYGLVSVPALVEVLSAGKNVTELWNAALTVGALRDQEGPAYELALAPPALLKVLRGEGDVHKNAMAALALGCFHFAEAEPRSGGTADVAAIYDAVPGVAQRLSRSASALRAARDELAVRIKDPSQFMRIAAMFALAKMGGDEARAAFLARKLDLTVSPQLLRAHLLASAFLGVEDGAACLAALDGRNGTKAASTIEKGSAALAAAVAMLREEPVAWTQEDDALLRHLRGVAVTQASELSERIFARGILAYVRQREAAWDDVWKIAILPSTNSAVVAAAAQILVHCPVPALERRMVRWAVAPLKKDLHESLQALVLLRAGAEGSPASIAALADWLRSRAKRPAANSRWDPRWYAVIGLLRALHTGAIRPRAERRVAIKALRKAVATTLDKDAAILAPLRALMDIHAKKLVEAEETSLYLLPAKALRRVEASFACPHGLLTHDAIEACVHRVNAMVFQVFGLEGIAPWKPGGDNTRSQPERHLKRYLRAFPYFTRLEFRTERGRRAAPELPAGAKGIDR